MNRTGHTFHPPTCNPPLTANKFLDMPSKTKSFVSPRYSLWAQIGLLISSFAWLYAHTIVKLINDWNTNDNFSHGFLIPLISAFMIWKQRERLTKKVVKPSAWGLCIVLGAMLMHIAGNIGAELFVMRTFELFCVSWDHRLSFWVFNHHDCFYTVDLLVFHDPIPSIIWNQIAFPLQLLAARLAGAWFNLWGSPF